MAAAESVPRTAGIETIKRLAELQLPALHNCVGKLEVAPNCHQAYIVDDAAIWLHAVRVASDGTVTTRPSWPFPPLRIVVLHESWDDALAELLASCKAYYMQDKTINIDLEVLGDHMRAVLTAGPCTTTIDCLPEHVSLGAWLRDRPASILRTPFQLATCEIVNSGGWLDSPVICMLDEQRLQIKEFLDKWMPRGFTSYYLMSDPNYPQPAALVH
jgi:hypothetical protein